MTAQTKTVLKSYFETGDTPTQAQFEDLIDTIPGALGAIADGDIPASIARDSEVAASYRPITEKSQAIFTIEGSLTVGSGTIRIRNRTGRTLTISEVHCEVNTAPVGAAIIVDIHKNDAEQPAADCRRGERGEQHDDRSAVVGERYVFDDGPRPGGERDGGERSGGHGGVQLGE